MTAAIITPYIDGVFVIGMAYAMITLGLQVTLSSGQFSVAHAALAGLGGYAGGAASVSGGWPFAVGLSLGVLAGAIGGTILALALIRTSGILLGTVTIAVGHAVSVIMRNIDSIFGVKIGGSQGLSGIPTSANLPWATAALVLAVGFALALRSSIAGYSMMAVGRDETVARSLGISVLGVRVWGFAGGGALAGLGGALIAHNNGIVEPKDLSFAAEPLFFIFLMIGGYSSPWGAVAGAIGVWWLQELLRFPWTSDGSLWFIDQQDRYWILGLVLVVTVIFRQEGVLVRRPIKMQTSSDASQFDEAQ